MALTDNAWYCNFGDGSTTGYYAVTQWATGTVTAAGTIIRQKTTPAVASERCFICVVAGTTHATTEPTWVITRGAKTTDNTVTWQECTGLAGINGDLTNTPTWTTIKNTAITLGQLIQRDNGASYQICTTAGTAGNGAEPAFSNTAGTTTADNTVTWTSLGVVGNFTGWQAPAARLAHIISATWMQSGNRIYVGNNHAETQTTTNSIVLPVSGYIVSVDHTTNPPCTYLAGASCTIGAANAALTFGMNSAQGVAIMEGFTLTGGSGAGASATVNINTSNTGAYTCRLRNSSIVLRTTGAVKSQWGNTATSSETILENVNVTLGSGTGTGINPRQKVTWRGGTLSLGATQPTTLFTTNSSSEFTDITVEGVDLSAYTGTTFVTEGGAVTNFRVKDCKLGAFTNAITSVTRPGTTIDFIRSGTTNVGYNLRRIDFWGDLTTETTIVRTGGASDGVTPVSWKIVSTSSNEYGRPFIAPAIRIWNDVVSPTARTVTLYGIWGGGAVPTNFDVYFDVFYLSDASSSLGSFVTNAPNSKITTATSHSSDSSTWGGSTTAFKMSQSFTAQKAGYIYLYVRVPNASTTVYIDPSPVLS